MSMLDWNDIKFPYTVGGYSPVVQLKITITRDGESDEVETLSFRWREERNIPDRTYKTESDLMQSCLNDAELWEEW